MLRNQLKVSERIVRDVQAAVRVNNQQNKECEFLQILTFGLTEQRFVKGYAVQHFGLFCCKEIFF